MNNVADIITAYTTDERGMGEFTGGRRYSTHDEIARLAYSLHSSRGRRDGRHIEDGLLARPGACAALRAIGEEPANTLQLVDSWRSRANERLTMTIIKLMLALVCFVVSGMVMAQDAKVTPLMSKDLTGPSGKEVLMIAVEYPPGSADPVHRHNAQALVYVLEGSVVMQVKGGKEVTLTPGQTFYEGPNDVHVVGRNTSNTKPAKLLVVLVKAKGAPVLVPVK
jgi:quercetin dioxygenase-like cupin family protein